MMDVSIIRANGFDRFREVMNQNLWNWLMDGVVNLMNSTRRDICVGKT